MSKEVLSWIKTLALSIALAFIVKQFIFVPTEVQGESMMPSLQDGNKLIVSKISDIDRFDTIVFHAPDADERYVKRVIGIPGDTIEMKNDTLYINGKAYEESYLKEHKKELLPMQKLTGDFTLEEITNYKNVPEGYLFVLGDNRLKSKDSRYFGLIPMDSVIGTAELKVWPINEIGTTK